MDTYFISLLVLSFSTYLISYFDEPENSDEPPFFNNFALKHPWCRAVTKILFFVTGILFVSGVGYICQRNSPMTFTQVLLCLSLSSLLYLLWSVLFWLISWLVGYLLKKLAE